MALVNHTKREINAKIVYYGPGLAGKATNLNFIYKKLKPEYRGKLKVMNIQKERMLFFDFTPTGESRVDGYNVRFHVYTIIGEVSYAPSWKMVVKGADGVVFVADSRRERMAANQESFKDLGAYLNYYGKELEDLPAVIQCNKQDLENAVSPEEMERALNPGRLALIPTVAERGEGVLDTLFNVVNMVLKDLRERGMELNKDTEAAVASSVNVMEGAAALSQPAISVEGADAGRGEPVIEFFGPPELLDGGSIRLPLSVRYNDREKRVAIHISITSDND